ncbi:FAD-dependent monooxygenase [Kribbella sp. NPDC051137]|uniref:FAD-dependent monooxygenase n=1 Tax=Kribbella sp. NPDC051137 TaxID=3155045 RepID=UPI003425380E
MISDVVVVGAGPTGLTMAVELARRGVAVRLIDASPAPISDTRALGVQPRTLELFERLGLASDAVAQGVPVTEFRLFSEGKQFLSLSLRDLETPHPYLLMLPQPQVEALLRGRLEELGVEVQHGVELARLEQTPQDVAVTLAHSNGNTEQVSARWVVGCDGAHSTVRKQLGVGFVGEAFEENFAVADLRMDWQLPHDVFHSYLDRGQFVAYFPMPGGLHRITIAYPAGKAPEGEVTLDELQAAVDVCAPAGAKVGEVKEARRFRIQQRKVARHSVGRVFLAGDAAHIHSVVGGQGMNTGIQDAFNLGWKIAAVVHDRAHPELLDSYAVERSPVAQRLVRGTRRATRVTLLHSPLATALRRNLAPRITSRPAMQRTLARALTQLDVSYRDSSGSDGARKIAVGDRFPDIRMLDPSRHTLVVPGPEPAGLTEVLEGRSDLVHVERVMNQTRLSDGLETGLTLVRPDNHLALVGADLRQLWMYLDANCRTKESR